MEVAYRGIDVRVGAALDQEGAHARSPIIHSPTQEPVFVELRVALEPRLHRIHFVVYDSMLYARIQVFGRRRTPPAHHTSYDSLHLYTTQTASGSLVAGGRLLYNPKHLLGSDAAAADIIDRGTSARLLAIDRPQTDQ